MGSQGRAWCAVAASCLWTTVLLGSLPLLLGAEDDVDYVEALREAESLYVAGSYSQALLLANNLVKKFPHDETALSLAAVVGKLSAEEEKPGSQSARRKLEQGLAYTRRALAIIDDPQLHFNAAVILCDLARYHEALSHIQGVLGRRSPDELAESAYRRGALHPRAVELLQTLPPRLFKEAADKHLLRDFAGATDLIQLVDTMLYGNSELVPFLHYGPGEIGTHISGVAQAMVEIDCDLERAVALLEVGLGVSAFRSLGARYGYAPGSNLENDGENNGEKAEMSAAETAAKDLDWVQKKLAQEHEPQTEEDSDPSDPVALALRGSAMISNLLARFKHAQGKHREAELIAAEVRLIYRKPQSLSRLTLRAFSDVFHARSVIRWRPRWSCI